MSLRSVFYRFYDAISRYRIVSDTGVELKWIYFPTYKCCYLLETKRLHRFKHQLLNFPNFLPDQLVSSRLGFDLNLSPSNLVAYKKRVTKKRLNCSYRCGVTAKAKMKDKVLVAEKQLTLSRSSYPEVFLRKNVLRICNRFTREHPYRSVISIKFQSNFVEITLRQVGSPVNLLHIFRTPFSTYTSGWLLLSMLFFTLASFFQIDFREKFIIHIKF